MTTDQLRSVRDANPFQPFTIHLADGRSLRVPHRDFLSLHPVGRTMIVYKSDGAFSIVDVVLVTEVAVEPAQAAPSGEPG